MTASFDVRRVLDSPFVYTSLMTALEPTPACAGSYANTCGFVPAIVFSISAAVPGGCIRTCRWWIIAGSTRTRPTGPRAAIVSGGALRTAGRLEGLPRVRNARVRSIVASGLLHHLPNAAAACALAFCQRRLRTGGRLVALDCALEPGQGFLSRLLVSRDRGRFVRTGRGCLDLAREFFPDTTLVIRHDLLRVPTATRLWSAKSSERRDRLRAVRSSNSGGTRGTPLLVSFAPASHRRRPAPVVPGRAQLS